MTTSVNRLVFMVALASSIGVAGETLSGQTVPAGESLADALIEVKSDENSWLRSAGLLAYSLQMGIPENRFREIQPGARLDALPAKVLSTLRQDARGIPAWIHCFDDKRPTGILQNDLFGGGSSKDAKTISCGDAAAAIVASLLPASVLPVQEQDETPSKELLAKGAERWEARVLTILPGDRMKAWFDGADDHQRRLFLAIAIQMRHAHAYPLLEANFLERANTADAFLYLEVSAYFRHRRSAGRKLFEALASVLRGQPGPSGSDAHRFLSMWKLLTDYDTLEPAVNNWLAGRLELAALDDLLVRSVDQPWAYHSLGIEPTSVFRPTMEQNLRTLVAAAASEQNLEKRHELLRMGGDAATILHSILRHTNSLEQLPPPRSDAAEWQLMVPQLRELFRDKRYFFDGRLLMSPGEQAAEIVWELWKPGEQHYDPANNAHLPDWRLQAFAMHDNSCRSLLVPSAEDFVSHPAGTKPQTYPETAAAAMASTFVERDAIACRRKLEPLRWDERLLVQAEASRDRKFALRLWPRLIEFVDWAGTTSGQPPSFSVVWRDRIVGRNLNDATWQALRDWLVSEAREGRYWTIIGESHPVWPGISLYVSPTSPQADKAGLFDGYIDFGITVRSRGESFRISDDGLQKVVLERDQFAEDSPLPMAAIDQQNAKKATDDDLCDRGFTLQMIVFPPIKQE